MRMGSRWRMTIWPAIGFLLAARLELLVHMKQLLFSLLQAIRTDGHL